MELAPGLPPDEVEKLRWQAFGQKRALALRDAPDLERFTAERGFVLVYPAAGVHYPSALEAAVGRPLLEHVPSERTADLEAWSNECVRKESVVRATFVDRRDTLVAREWVADVLACGARAVAAVATGTTPSPDPDAARVRLAARVLRNILLVTSEDLAQLLGWDEPAARAALDTLVTDGEALVHPQTRPRRATFQARTTDLLAPVPPA